MTQSSYRPFRMIDRRKTRQIMVGNVPVGGDAPITVQTMTNTLTTDIEATCAQINSAVEAGADIVRVSCPDEASTKALKQICDASPVPIVAVPTVLQRRGAGGRPAACTRRGGRGVGAGVRVHTPPAL